MTTELNAPRAHQSAPEWWDRLIGSDPGLLRLMTAAQAVVTIGVAMIAERVFVETTHALQLQINAHGAPLPPKLAAEIAIQHHAILVIAIMLGAIVGMLSAFSTAMFPTTRKQIEGFVLMPVLMLAGLTIGLSLAKIPHRSVSLIGIVVVLALGAYCRRFGPLGFIGGQLVFMGDFFGFFLSTAVHLEDMGWLAAEICIGVIIAALCRFTIFRRRPRAALRRLLRSNEARAVGVLNAALEFLDYPDQAGAPDITATDKWKRASRRLHRRLIRLNETSLMVAAQLNNPSSVPANVSPAAMHQSVFDTDLAVTNMARFAERLAREGVTGDLRAQVTQILREVSRRDPDRAEIATHQLLNTLRVADTDLPAGESKTLAIVAHRFAISALGFLDAVKRSHTLADATAMPSGEQEPFATPVMTLGDWLPGSSLLSAAASTEPSEGRLAWLRPWRHVAIPGNVRIMIQMTVAVGLAVVLGNMVSERRFYWAVIAAFITFMGANNTGEQARKAIFRVLGTAIGIVFGAIFAHLVGSDTDWAIAVILISLFIGLYLMRISYAFMVIGITIMVSQLYVQLDEYTNDLLLLRLAETALGAAITVLVILFVLPLRTTRVARGATRSFLGALDNVIDIAADTLLDPATARRQNELPLKTRALDDAYQSFIITTNALRTPFSTNSDKTVNMFRQALTGVRHYARNLVVDTRDLPPLPAEAHEPLRQASERLRNSIAALVEAISVEPAESTESSESSGADPVYVRSAIAFDTVATRLDGHFADPQQLAFRDLQLIDGALAPLGDLLKVPVDDGATVGTTYGTVGA